MGQFDNIKPELAERAGLYKKNRAAITEASSALSESNLPSLPVGQGIEPATPDKAAKIPSVPGKRPGMVLSEDFTSPRSEENLQGGQAPVALPVTAGRKAKSFLKLSNAAGRAQTKLSDKVERARQISGLKTTSMRLDEKTGEAYDTEDVKPDKARPAPVIAGTHPRPLNTSAKPTDWEEIPVDPYLAEKAAKNMNPGSKQRARREKVQASIQKKHDTYTAGELEFNANQSELDKKISESKEGKGNRARRRAGSTLRSENGITYDILDRKAEEVASDATRPVTGTVQVPVLDKQKRPVIASDPKDASYKINGKTFKKTVNIGKPVTKPVETYGAPKKPFTFDEDLNKAVSENDVIPASPRAPKDTAEGEDYRPSSIIPTQNELKDLELAPLESGENASGQYDEANPVAPTAPKKSERPDSIEYADTKEGKAAAKQDAEDQKGKDAVPGEETEPVSNENPREKEVREAEESIRKGASEYEAKEKKNNGKRGPLPQPTDDFGTPISHAENRALKTTTMRMDPKTGKAYSTDPADADFRDPKAEAADKEAKLLKKYPTTMARDEKGNAYDKEDVMPEGYEDPLDEQGNVKPAYRDPNSPLSTTMRPITEPNPKANTETIQNIGESPRVGGAAGIERSRRIQVGSDILKEKTVSAQLKDYQPIVTGATEGAWNRMPSVPAPKADTPRDMTGVIPQRAFEDNSAPGEEAITYNEAVAKASGDTLSDDERTRQANKAKAPQTGTGPYDFATRPAGATAGRTPEQQAADLERRKKFESKFGGEMKDTRYAGEVYDTAKLLAANAGVVKNIDEFDNPSDAVRIGMQPHIAKAHLLHETGDSSPEAIAKLDTVAGGPAGTARNLTAIAGMSSTLKDEDTFNKTKEPGTGVTYSMDGTGTNHLDPEVVKFRAKNGALVPLSEVNHPDHPLPGGKGTLEGSAVPAVGGVPDPRNPGRLIAIPAKHHGWHPNSYKNPDGSELKILEHNTVPAGFVHHAEVIRGAISAGKSLTQQMRDVYSGNVHENMTLDDGTPVQAATGPRFNTSNGSRKRIKKIATDLADTQSTAGTDATSETGEEESSSTSEGLYKSAAQVKSQRIFSPELGPEGRSMTPEEKGLGAKLPKGVKGARELSKKAAGIEAAAAPKMFTPGESVFHPKHGVGTVVSHNLDFGTPGNTTAVVKFGDKEKTFNGDNLHTHITDKQGKTTKNQELSRFTPSTTPTAVTHKQHGTGTVLGYSSNHDGSGKTHVKFDSGATKAISDSNKLDFNV